jgi:hypothetical protein
MKLWFKYLAGIVFGALLFWVSPPSLFEPGAAFYQASEIALRIGFYVLELLLLVNLPLAVVKLYEEKRFWGLTFKSLSFFALSLSPARFSPDLGVDRSSYQASPPVGYRGSHRARLRRRFFGDLS